MYPFTHESSSTEHFGVAGGSTKMKNYSVSLSFTRTRDVPFVDTKEPALGEHQTIIDLTLALTGHMTSVISVPCSQPLRALTKSPVFLLGALTPNHNHRTGSSRLMQFDESIPPATCAGRTMFSPHNPRRSVLSTPHVGPRRTLVPQRSKLHALILFVLVQAACVTTGHASLPTGVHPSRHGWAGGKTIASHYQQSCTLNPICGAPTASGEVLIPAVRTLVRATEAASGLLTLKNFLDEAEVARVEQVLIQCAKEADSRINKQEYPKEGYPSDSECGRVVGYSSKGKTITRAMELGTMKHEVAFSCVERELGKEFSAHLTREPRYGKRPPHEKYILTDEGVGSLIPDIVLHLERDANIIHHLYDFFFPCTSRSKSDPLAAQVKLDKYRPLAGDGTSALVTPQLGISR